MPATRRFEVGAANLPWCPDCDLRDLEDPALDKRLIVVSLTLRGLRWSGAPVTAVHQHHSIPGQVRSHRDPLLAEIGMVRELTDKRRNRLFVCDRYLAILNEGAEVP